MVYEQILLKYSELTLPQFLSWLTTSGILAGIGKKCMGKVNELIRNRYNEGHYAFVPNKEEALTLKKVSEKNVYLEFKKLLKNHWGIDVVRTGLYLRILEQKGDVERIKEIKKQVFKNRKLAGLRLIEMVVEGVIEAGLDHLNKLKEKHNYSQEDLDNAFDDLLHTWEKITIFIRNENSVDEILSKTKELIDKKEETFFLFAKGKAIVTACSVLVQLQKEKYIIPHGYIWFISPDNQTVPPSYYCVFHSSTFLI